MELCGEYRPRRKLQSIIHRRLSYQALEPYRSFRVLGFQGAELPACSHADSRRTDNLAHGSHMSVHPGVQAGGRSPYAFVSSIPAPRRRASHCCARAPQHVSADRCMSARASPGGSSPDLPRPACRWHPDRSSQCRLRAAGGHGARKRHSGLPARHACRTHVPCTPPAGPPRHPRDSLGDSPAACFKLGKL